MLDDILGKNGANTFADEAGHLIEQLRQLGYREVRPWPEFFSSLKPPQWNWKHLEQRITTNFLQYRSNYLVISGVIVALHFIFCPFEMLTLLIVGIIDAYLLFSMTRPIKIGDLVITDEQKKAVVGVSSGIILILSGAVTAITWTLLYCVMINGVHMIFRPRSVTSKTNKVYEEVKINGYNNWFGGGESNTSNFDNTDLESSNYGRTDSSSMRKRAGNVPVPIRPVALGNGLRKAE